ncbi:MAG: hypothetical protein F4X83_04550 [Chloroflexi bacterium]|nr:hypothetical protein [Chloroflexota bacterium]
MQFGSLESVPLREAWPNEARDFTPWLADNLELLTEAIGLQLELTDVEVSVDEFSADILAHNPREDTAVLIENQLESSDHSHLGQILTYLAGLQAKTVIWIAREFSEAHLSAVRWLNENTDTQYAFFAVQVRAVRIGESLIAPVLEIREQPSSWDRQLRQLSQDSESELSKFRREFWEYYAERFPNDFSWRPGYRGSNVWHRVDSADLRISQYLAPSAQEVGVYVTGQVGQTQEDILSRVKPFVARFEQELGVELGENHSLVSVLRVDPKDREKWESIAEWLHDSLVSFRDVLEEGPG